MEQLRGELMLAQQKLHAAQLKIQALTLELAHHKRLRFGQKSEALAVNQGDLFAETALIDQAAIEAELERAANQINPPTRRLPRVRAGRQPLPDHLPRIEHRHERTSCQCGQCGQDLIKIGEDITEQLDVEPARFFVHRHIRPQYTVVVLDNASIHTAKVVTEKLPEWESRNLFLYFLPTYSPELNIIEMVWKKIKYEWLPLSAYESFDSLWKKLNDMVPKIGFEYNIYFA